MKKKLITVGRALLSALLALLGFSGCEYIGRCEYGCPHADYKLQGTVTDARTKQPVKNIRAVFCSGGLDVEYSYKDTLYTDESGKIERDYPSMTIDHTRLQVLLEDIDGDENGSYETLLLEKENLPVKQVKKGDKHWYQGSFTITADAELNEYIPPVK